MRLKGRRKISGLKQGKIAESLGISRIQYYFIEIGKCKPDKLKREKLATIFNCTEKEILDDWEEAHEKFIKS